MVNKEPRLIGCGRAVVIGDDNARVRVVRVSAGRKWLHEGAKQVDAFAPSVVALYRRLSHARNKLARYRSCRFRVCWITKCEIKVVPLWVFPVLQDCNMIIERHEALVVRTPYIYRDRKS